MAMQGLITFEKHLFVMIKMVKKSHDKELDLRKFDKELSPADAVEARRSSLEEFSRVSLKNIGSSSLDYPSLVGKNAENVIGSVEIPLGVIGPLRINGRYADGDFYIPMATTEGALIASVGRGAKAASSSGGVNARILKDEMTRGPVFRLDSVSDSEEFLKWINDNYDAIKESAESTTGHGKLSSIVPFVLGNNVWLRFGYKTGDAMGMNMATIATEAACSYIEDNFGRAELIAISGNMCSDKKESMVNNLYGRGKSVVAEALISKEILESVFHGVLAKDVHDTNLRKNWLGSARAGSSKYNAHFANTVAAIFLATGQDPAQVVESSSGYTWTEARGEDLYISVTMPSLEVGTVGGGTHLGAQKEALSLVKAYGGGDPPGSNSAKLAEIIASAVLCGELNLLAALSMKELGKAHKKLGRNMK